MFQIPLGDARKLLRTGEKTQQIVIMLKDYRKSGMIAGRIRSLLHDDHLSVMSWTETGDWAQMVRSSSIMFTFMYLVIAFLGAFIITNIMMMVVLERRKEIGIIKSMGVSKREVLVLFLFEGVVLGCIGSVAGMIPGVLINGYFAVKGFDMSAMMRHFNFPLDNVLYFDISPASIVHVLLIGIIVSALVSVLPSWRASRMNAVEAIKSV